MDTSVQIFNFLIMLNYVINFVTFCKSNRIIVCKLTFNYELFRKLRTVT